MSLTLNNFQLMAKPSGSVCNIDCTYCFYLEKEHLYPDRKNHWKMDLKTLENYIIKNIQAQNHYIIDFIWQGGEPTLLGLDFYRHAIELQCKHHGTKHINNYFQTNGTRIDDEWAAFFKEHNFLIGISIDGDRIINDTYRLSRNGKSTFDDVLKGISALKRHKVEFNTLTVVNRENMQRPLDTYNFLKRIGSRYMQFIPLVERQAAQPDSNGLTLIQPDFSGQCQVTDWSVSAKGWGKFMNTIFDHWVVNDLGEVFVMNFEQTMAKINGQLSSCWLNETCGGNLIVEANGDIYSCDHFVYPENKLGNINNDDLLQLVNKIENIEFGQRKFTNISKECHQCFAKHICNGGCPKQRFELSSNGIANKNYLCDGFRIHLHHTLPKMNYLLDVIKTTSSVTKATKKIKNKFYR
ncbi:anaerobic sulfatase maturase [Salmonella enterica subsp. enterica]|nr:anaerobic sulfatase maturase [Salmonella enterica subsp. enterica serovar Omuna]EDH5629692.1 anaerobic sulfatase maturase [Salmonella enterica subsp. enterica serovar Claibornei]EDS6038676.1 anaerobic sulfatase maturase [Salmonella enterica subsp. enterica serovar Lexington]HED5893969.1 anaerobic sulfatase maturase [Salmonella enterica]